jgi:hypothetical protein
MHNSEVESTKENPVLLGVVLRGYVVFEEWLRTYITYLGEKRSCTNLVVYVFDSLSYEENILVTRLMNVLMHYWALDILPQ